MAVDQSLIIKKTWLCCQGSVWCWCPRKIPCIWMMLKDWLISWLVVSLTQEHFRAVTLDMVAWYLICYCCLHDILLFLALLSIMFCLVKPHTSNLATKPWDSCICRYRAITGGWQDGNGTCSLDALADADRVLIIISSFILESFMM